jgi:hypothetical protein
MFSDTRYGLSDTSAITTLGHDRLVFTVFHVGFQVAEEGSFAVYGGRFFL